MIYDSSKQKYIKDKNVYLKYPDKFNHLIQLQEECIPVYKGTEMIDNTFYEVIELFTKADVEIEYVELIKIHDERYSKKINYELKDNYIYIKSEDINFYKYDFNIAVQFNHHKSALVLLLIQTSTTK